MYAEIKNSAVDERLTRFQNRMVLAELHVIVHKPDRTNFDGHSIGPASDIWGASGRETDEACGSEGTLARGHLPSIEEQAELEERLYMGE